MHEEALTKEAADFLPKFSRFEMFYLVGGTALALQIGHRISADFDFFSEKEFSANVLQLVKQTFTDSFVTVTYRVPEQLNVVIGEVQTTFLYYPYPVIDPFLEYQGIRIAAIREIAAMKAYAIGRRLSYKDYVDWYFMLKENHVQLDDVITLARKKFGGDFNDRLFL